MADKNTRYAEARMALDSAMREFVEAAQAVEFDSNRIAGDVCDSLHDASDKHIVIKEFHLAD